MNGRFISAVAAALVVGLAIAGCSSATSRGGASTVSASAVPSNPRTLSNPAPSETPTLAATSATTPTPAPAIGSVKVDRTIATGLNVPWGLARLPGGDILVTSRDTYRLTRIDLATGASTLVGAVSQAVSNVSQAGEAGLLGIAVSPHFSTDHRLFIYYSTAGDNRVARFTYDQSAAAGHQLTGQTIILSGIPHSVHHNGGRLGFGPDGMLYVGTGDASESSRAQNRSDLGGKILRITADGKPAPGNPWAGSPVWTMGHRNVEGMAWDPAGRMWASEFGDKKADELNLIVKGHNYGWPDVEGKGGSAGFTDPVAQWGTEADSPSGIAIAGGSVWMAALKGERLWRIPLNGTGLAAQPTAFLTGTYGRLRSVLTIDDHTILVTTSNTDGRAEARSGDDRILELTVS